MRLFRPSIPTETRLRAALLQLGEMWPEPIIEAARRERRLKAALTEQLETIANLLDCNVDDLHLDHDPAIAARLRKGEGKHTVYTPDANDPEYLIYREKHAHDIKTRIRGEHGQYSDLALIKRERRRTSTKKRPKRKWPSRKLQSRGFSRP